MVFPFLGEKFNGPLQALSLLDGVEEPLIGAVYIQQIGLPAQLGRGMSVRIGNELQAVPGRTASSSWEDPRKAPSPPRGCAGSVPQSIPPGYRSRKRLRTGKNEGSRYGPARTWPLDRSPGSVPADRGRAGPEWAARRSGCCRWPPARRDSSSASSSPGSRIRL